MARVIGGIVRLPFHDAVTYNPTKAVGGPDGCIDFSSSDNGGLLAVWTKSVTSTITLQSIYNKYSARLSQGDFWALAGMVAVMMAGGPDISGRTGATCTCVADACIGTTAAAAVSPCMQFNYGRVDTPYSSCAVTDIGLLPSSQLAHQHIIDVFITRLGFNAAEVVSLMGGHTVGRAVLDESRTGFTSTELTTNGFNGVLSGSWDQSPDRFDNKYFQQIRNVSWHFQTHTSFTDGSPFTSAPAKTFQWSDVPRGSLMLNTDMALVWDVTITVPVTAGGTTVDCLKNVRGPAGRALGGRGLTIAQLFGVCGKSNTFEQYVEEFANTAYGQTQFFAQWSSAYTKLLELGWRDATKKGTLSPITTNTKCV